jgi:Terpene cyclase DEP1
MQPDPTQNRSPVLGWVYLALAITGAVLPWLANLDYMQQYGSSFDLGLFVQLANANPAAQSLSRDLLVGASAVTIWMVSESRRLGMRHLWVVLLSSVTIAFACAAPLFLYLRERRLAELARENESLPSV